VDRVDGFFWFSRICLCPCDCLMHYLFDRPLDTFNTSNYTGNYEKIRTPTDLAGPHAINEQGHGYSGILYYVTSASTNISKCTAEIIKVTFDCHRTGLVNYKRHRKCHNTRAKTQWIQLKTIQSLNANSCWRPRPRLPLAVST